MKNIARIDWEKWPVLSRRVAGIVCVVILVFAAPTATQITLEEDITALLPGEDSDHSSLAQLSRKLGLMSKVLVVMGSEGGDREGLHALVDQIVAAVESLSGVRSVIGLGDVSENRRSAEVILTHAFRLFRPTLPDGELRDVRTRLADLKKRLASPEAMVIGSYLASDPLGVARQTLAGLESQASASGTTLEAGHFLSTDKTAAIVILELDFDPYEVSKSQLFISSLEKKIRQAKKEVGASDIQVTALGGVHYVVANAGSAQADVTRSFVATSVLVLLVFFLLFRSIRLLPIAIFPGGVGIAVSLGVFGAVGYPLHPLTLGFAATITGMSVDYAIHLMYRAKTALVRGSEARIQVALRQTARPIFLGCLTTLGAFLLVSTSDFTGIRQMALFSAISIPVAMLVTLFILPAFHSFLAIATDYSRGGLLSRAPLGLLFARSSSRSFRVVVSALFIGLFLVGSFYASKVELSGDPRDLGSQNADLQTREERVRAAFPSLLTQVHFVTVNQNSDLALRENDLLYRRLLERGIPRDAIISLSPFLPSLETQQESLDVLDDYLFSEHKKNEVKDAFLETGFTEDYYASLKERMEIPPITEETYKDTSLFRLIRDSVHFDDGNTMVVTRVQAKNDQSLLELEGIARENTAWKIASERLETRRVLELFQKELLRMLITWVAATLLLLSLLERSLWYGIRAILPALLGVTAAVGLFAFQNRPLTPVASAGLTLVLGLGIDYGLFMQSESNDINGTATAIIASALTTIAAFGVLGFATTQAMSDLGIIILVGVSGSLLAAVGLLPALGLGNRQ